MSSRVVKFANERGEFITLEDGFVYYWPKGPGALSSNDLMLLAAELERRNKPWEDQIIQHFEEEKKKFKPRCSVCGKFVKYGSPSTFMPDNIFGPEEIQFYCKEHWEGQK